MLSDNGPSGVTAEIVAPVGISSENSPKITICDPSKIGGIFNGACLNDCSKECSSSCGNSNGFPYPIKVGCLFITTGDLGTGKSFTPSHLIVTSKVFQKVNIPK